MLSETKYHSEMHNLQKCRCHCLNALMPEDALQWRHNGRDGASNHQAHECLPKAQIKGNITAPCHWPFWGEFAGGLWIPLQRASNAGNVSIWWRHYVWFVSDFFFRWGVFARSFRSLWSGNFSNNFQWNVYQISICSWSYIRKCRLQNVVFRQIFYITLTSTVSAVNMITVSFWLHSLILVRWCYRV